jgi:hypothetical protein
VQTRSQGHFTSQRRDGAEDRLEERRFARAVRSDQRRAVQASQFDVRAGEKKFFGDVIFRVITHFQVPSANHQIAGSTRRTQMQVQVGRDALRRSKSAHTPLGFLHAERRLGRFNIQLRPVHVDRIHAHLLDGLHNARESFEFALGLQCVLPRNIFLDVLNFF